MDDRVTLMNGEKVLPLSIEGRIRKDPLIKEAVVFGIDEPVPGLLVFRADSAEGLSNEDYLNQIWPAVQDANSRAEGFAQITREVIAIIPAGVDCPTTDKSSIKRVQVYREFAPIIDEIYAKLKNSTGGDLQLEVPALESWILKAFKESLGVELDSPETDFFLAGVDSLKAIQMRGLIVRSIDLGGNASKCASMVVADCGNAVRLAKVLYALRMDEEMKSDDEIEAMQAMIDKYSIFQKHVPGNAPTPKRSTIVSVPLT